MFPFSSFVDIFCLFVFSIPFLLSDVCFSIIIVAYVEKKGNKTVSFSQGEMSIFYDLNVSLEKGVSRLHSISNRLSELKYSRASVNRYVFGSIPKTRKEDADAEIDAENRKYRETDKDVRIGKKPSFLMSRVTISGDKLSLFQAISTKNVVLKTYDIVATSPQTQQTFKFCCRDCAGIDIITIDSEQRLPYVLNRTDIDAAIKRGIHFEVTYSGSIRDASHRRYFVSNAMALVRATRGRNIIISSGADSAHILRSPYDALNLGVLVGLTFTQARACVSTNCERVLEHAKKRSLHRGYIEVVKIDDDKLDQENSWMRTEDISSTFLSAPKPNESDSGEFIRL